MGGNTYSYLIESKAVSLASSREELSEHCGKLLTQIDVKRKSMYQKRCARFSKAYHLELHTENTRINAVFGKRKFIEKYMSFFYLREKEMCVYLYFYT